MLLEEHDQTELGNGTWLWSDCKLVLRRTNPNNPSEESYENLEAEVQLQSDEIQQPFIPVFTFSKSFFFNNKKGFYWKKGTPLPSLSVKLQKSYLQLLQQDEEIIMIYCELTVAYPRRKETHFYLEEVRTIGDRKKPFSPDGTVYFDGIVIKESSMQRSNNKFSFLVTICASSIEENKIILKTLISTAFYTQIPRIVRRTYKKSYRLTQFVSPSKFLKPISQVRSIMQKSPKQILLSTLKYLNQQQKLSFHHLFYLIYHFSSVLKVYYQSKEINSLSEALDLISILKNQQIIEKSKNPFIIYELKKTKKIKKTCDSISVNPKIKRRIKIQGVISNGCEESRKPLLVTFRTEILRLLDQQIELQTQNDPNSLKKQVQDQMSRFIRKMRKLNNFFIKFDLLREEPLSSFWKNIEKDTIFEAYKNNYQKIYAELKNTTEKSKN